MKDVSDLFPESIPPALEKARVTSAAEAEYISRPDIEAKINDFLGSKNIILISVIHSQDPKLKL